MVTNLTKGQVFDLQKEDPELNSVFVGIGWDVGENDGTQFDLDACAFLMGSDGLVSEASDFIYFRNLRHPTGAVVHSGDNTTGDGEGDDEAITVDFSLLPDSVSRIAFTVSIYEAFERQQTFGQIRNAYIRFYDPEVGEIFRFDLGEEFSDDTAIVFGELVKKAEGGWAFAALGEGLQGGIIALSRRFGVFRK